MDILLVVLIFTGQFFGVNNPLKYNLFWWFDVIESVVGTTMINITLFSYQVSVSVN